MSSLAMFRGDDRVLTITADEALAGSDIVFTAKWRKTDADPVLRKTTGAGITVGDPATTAEVAIDAADTADLPAGVLHWEIEITDALDKVHTVATGILLIQADIES